MRYVKCGKSGLKLSWFAFGLRQGPYGVGASRSEQIRQNAEILTHAGFSEEEERKKTQSVLKEN